MWTRNWGWTIARGVAAILFGLCALFVPGVTWVGLMSFFAAYALIDGIGDRSSRRCPRNARIDPGACSWRGHLGIAVAAGVDAVAGGASVAFLYVLGSLGHRWRGCSRSASPFGCGGSSSTSGCWCSRAAVDRVRRHRLARPLAGALALVWWIGAYAIVFGG